MRPAADGYAVFCGLVCLWPLLFHVIALAVTKRVREHGWRSLFFGVTKHDQSL